MCIFLMHSSVIGTVIVQEGVNWVKWWIDIGALADHLRLPKNNPNATVTSIDQFLSLGTDITEIVIDNGMSESGFTGFDLSGFSRLKRLEIGSDCFSYVIVFNITGLSELESVEIGMNSFTKHKGSYDYDPNRHFYLKNCPKLKSLKMGRYSFSD